MVGHTAPQILSQTFWIWIHSLGDHQVIHVHVDIWEKFSFNKHRLLFSLILFSITFSHHSLCSIHSHLFGIRTKCVVKHWVIQSNSHWETASCHSQCGRVQKHTLHSASLERTAPIPTPTFGFLRYSESENLAKPRLTFLIKINYEIMNVCGWKPPNLGVIYYDN